MNGGQSADSPHGNGANGAAASGYLAELRLAVSFLTILPVIGERPAPDEAVAASFAWFPLVGFAIGAALCAEDWILAHLFGQVMRSVFVALSLTVITGAVHVDGLADTADALGAGRDRVRALEILRDSRAGAFGAIAIFFALTLKILALATLAGPRRYEALILAPGLARWAMVIVAHRMEYLRAEGAGAALFPGEGARRLMRACVTVAAALCLVFSMRAIGAAAIALIVAAAMRGFYRWWLGGVAGDLIGACGEIAEIAALVTMAS